MAREAKPFIPSPARRCTRNQKGFTLIEMMIVVVIIGVLAALITPTIMGRTDDARITAAQSDLHSIATALNLYRLDNFTYPSTAQGLQALVAKPAGAPEPAKWNPEGYLNQVPKDPWGRDYVYLSPGHEALFDLYSLGADGRDGSGDEIVLGR